ncbi:hypothetical protein BC832DRAFT_564078 [Gaertneriomyces semiglobifer]|nr:hypothetical protein BC832DRAFT_564078 [Gaertneriomyces semiglobifer]
MGELAGILRTEFQQDVKPIHEDYLVHAVEPVVESRRIITCIKDTRELQSIKIHMALVSESIIQFRLLLPQCGNEGIFWVMDAAGPTFNLSHSNLSPSGRQKALRHLNFLQHVRFRERACGREGDEEVRGTIAALSTRNWQVTFPHASTTTPKSRESSSVFTPNSDYEVARLNHIH